MKGPGCLISFELAGGGRAAARVLERLELLTPAVSLGSVDTLIQHPASLTHRVVDAKEREASGISEGMLRVSVGLENPEDLWADLQQALDALLSATDGVEEKSAARVEKPFLVGSPIQGMGGVEPRSLFRR
jgi:methionine-gamma-lyase